MLSWLHLILCFFNSLFPKRPAPAPAPFGGLGDPVVCTPFFQVIFVAWFGVLQDARHHQDDDITFRNLEFATDTGLGGRSNAWCIFVIFFDAFRHGLRFFFRLKMHVGQWRWSWTCQMSLSLYVWSYCWGTKIQPQIKKTYIYIFINHCFKHPIYTGWVIKSYRLKLRIFGHLRLRIAGPPPHPPPHYPPVAAAPGWTEEGELVTSAWSGDIFRKLISNFTPFISILVSNAFILDQIWIPFNLDSS